MITGTLDVKASSAMKASDPTCVAQAGLEDVKPGGPVIVADGAGVQIAKGSLAVDTDNSPIGWFQDTNTCRYAINVPNVPKSDTYNISVGTRKPASYSFAEMQGLDWKVVLYLG